MLEGESDPEMRSYLEAELANSEEAISSVEEQLRLALVERDPNDERDVIIELRPGAGGDEAALFTGDIYRMLMAYAQRLGYQVETLTATGFGGLILGTAMMGRSSSGSRACTACSACPRPSRRGGSTPRP